MGQLFSPPAIIQERDMIIGKQVSIHKFASFRVVTRKSTSESYMQFPQMTKNNFPRKNVPVLKLSRSPICILLQLFLIKLTLSKVCLDKNH